MDGNFSLRLNVDAPVAFSVASDSGVFEREKTASPELRA
jgi:hypothetical protein